MNVEPFPAPSSPERLTVSPTSSHTAKDHRRRRSSSLISKVEPETFETKQDQDIQSNMNANWVHFKGAWIIHIVIIILLKLFYDLIPMFNNEWSWTLTNVTYVIGSYIMFHQIKGTPFDFNNGAYDNLTMWEQIDNGDQYTPVKKFLMGVPIFLFLISTHYSYYDLNLFVVNLVACLCVVIPKLPYSHRVRVNIPYITDQN
ncbi:hypothetical protein KL930_004074 [Ogataea haglerorum]|uniref:Protein ORM1 n=3 Tax=Ogataea TaxID=461281 RepID=W1QH09_OGAPD|nr:Protein ORM1 [Ogataea parapolymorpha DL-1]XP_018210181.1 uncharacterized protein OGAPODRAFT_101756 [Ogataea polymorpha]XP_043055990.1 uncharacterized protein KL911_001417 [Ogataea haglerorum]XP_043057865.1 uncharacterized protein KL928_004870 [Ogataea angusta]KAG7865785.1 hypothetical protein KL918_004264 [Ogataea parapolymorpha]ESX01373.1 Protein ORM1 [Ogataea parapolymorpha DL-1]KAG7693322.1 hypothetical protein KL915_004221 [Ogataea haglerorum]KAG7694272.1 hypothetical protein KL951_00